MIYNGVLYGAIRSRYASTLDFANAVGISRNIVSQVVNGRWALSDAHKMKWAKALNAPVNHLWPPDGVPS